MFKDELIIIRHGRSINNLRQSDDPDCGITEYGKRQALNVGKFLAKHVDTRGFEFFTSPFLRCLQTAEAIQSEVTFDNPGYVLSGLREYVNHYNKEVLVKNRRSETYNLHWADMPREDVVYHEEFNETFLDRMVSLFEVLPSKSIVVTHGLPALMLLEIAKNPAVNSVPIWDHSIDNCSITRIVKGRVVWHGRNLFHEVDHDPFDIPRAHDQADMLVRKVS